MCSENKYPVQCGSQGDAFQGAMRPKRPLQQEEPSQPHLRNLHLASGGMQAGHIRVYACASPGPHAPNSYRESPSDGAGNDTGSSVGTSEKWSIGMCQSIFVCLMLPWFLHYLLNILLTSMDHLPCARHWGHSSQLDRGPPSTPSARISHGRP